MQDGVPVRFLQLRAYCSSLNEESSNFYTYDSDRLLNSNMQQAIAGIKEYEFSIKGETR